MWATRECISFLNLRAGESAPAMDAIKAGKLLAPGGQFWDACLTDSGDVVVAHYKWQSSESNQPIATRLVRLSKEGTVLFRFREHDRNEPSTRVFYKIASHGTKLYSLEFLPSNLQGHSKKTMFVARDLASGRILFQQSLLQSLWIDIREFAESIRSVSLSISSSGVWAIVSSRQCFSIVKTLNGKGSLFYREHDLGFEPIIGKGGNEIWCMALARDDYSTGFVFRYAYVAEIDEWLSTYVRFYWPADPWNPKYGFDPDRWVFFRLQPMWPPHGFGAAYPRRGSQNCTVLMGTGQYVDNPYTASSYMSRDRVEIKDMTAVTLLRDISTGPGSNGDDMQRLSRETLMSREKLTISNEWSLSLSLQFYGMVNDYLIFTVVNDRTLTVVDFWPTW